MKPLIIMLACVTVLACAHIDPTPHCPASDTCEFEGVDDVLRRDEIQRLHLIVVHGMGHHQSGFSSHLVEKIAAEMDFIPSAGGGVRRIPNPLDCTASAVLSVRSFVHPRTRKQLFVHEVTWAPIVDPLKQALDYDSAPSATSKRYLLNRGLKKSLINERLADPVLYIGFRGKAIRYPVELTLCDLLGGAMREDRCSFDATGGARAFDLAAYPRFSEKDAIAIVSFSLGSKVTFDALRTLIEGSGPIPAAGVAGEDSARGKLHGKITTFFMLANQLPLLEMAERDVLASGELPLAELARELGRLSETEPAFTVVAMSDPNDLLSYDISDTLALLVPDVRFANVNVKLGRSYLGLVSNPLGAHTRHEYSPLVLEYILHGSRRAQGGLTSR